MTRIPSWIIAIALTGYLQVAFAQNPAFVPQPAVGAKVGFATNFTCQSHGIPIGTCLWERDPPAGTSNSFILNFNAGNARPGATPPQPGYIYMGDGLEKGECGVVINSVKESDNGNWKCTLITNQGQLYRGVVDLGILKKPDPPKFNPSVLPKVVDSDDNRYRNNPPQQSRIICFSGNGQPQPRFQWFIDNEPLHEGLSPINTTIDGSTNVAYTFQELINHRFTWRDNGKKLRCVAVHEAFGPNDVREVSMDIDIQFPPRSPSDNLGSQVRVEIGKEKVLSVNVSSNPKPSRVEWNVDNKAYRVGEVTEKYDAMEIKEVENGVWEANLRIKSVDEEDINKQYLLKVGNDYGEAEFKIKIESDANGSGGLSAGGIVLLILGIAALIIIIAIITVYARAQGLLCFKGDDGTASEKERMDGGSTGGTTEEQQQQQKPGLKLTSRLSAFYDNLLNKKKDKPVPADEESATGNKDKDSAQGASSPTKSAQAPGTPLTAPPEDSERKPEDIVYAELDLARTGGGGNGPNPEIVVRASDDKTEYAEIVGVVQAGTIEEHKRSPSGSNKSGGSATDK